MKIPPVREGSESIIDLIGESSEEFVDSLESGEDDDFGVKTGSEDLYTCIIYGVIMHDTVYLNSHYRTKYANLNGWTPVEVSKFDDRLL